MQIHGIVNKLLFTVLVDSGSTHCFLDASLATNLDLVIEPHVSLWVIVANGRRLQCLGVCRKIIITLGDHPFCVDFLVIPLQGFGAVMCVNWLRNLGPIQWDFSTMSMSFTHMAETIVLQGITQGSGTHTRHLAATSVEDCANEDLTSLLEEFSCVFREPTGMPPSRNFRHRIVLEQGTYPVVVRPYRYPHAQKDEIERHCEDMLEKRPYSPQSFPLLLARTIG